ncbi:hypothetical protein B484DRAFT_394097 [Ochromonadaceae sp. CCMP2298]|nr:hypothetical protein B484DRAFT_394097 [Ochromonadaceae sp. CCMP2298]
MHKEHVTRAAIFPRGTAKAPAKQISIALRGAVYKDTDGTFKTLDCEPIMYAKVTSDIELQTFYDLVARRMRDKGIPNVNYKSGKFYAAQAKNSQVMKEISCRESWEEKLAGYRKKDFKMHVAIAGAHDTFDAATMDALKGSRDQSTVDHAGRLDVINFVEAMYWSELSPMHHGFTMYHAGTVQQHLVNVVGKRPELISDYKNGCFPLASAWPDYSPDGTWDTGLHQSMSQGCVMARDAHPPGPGERDIPSADYSAKRRTRATAAAGQSSSASSSSAAIDGVALQMAHFNQIAAARFNGPGPAAPAPAAVLAVDTPLAAAPPAAAPFAALTPTSEHKQKLKRKFDSLLQEQKQMYASGCKDDDEMILNCKRRLAKVHANMHSPDSDAGPI